MLPRTIVGVGVMVMLTAAAVVLGLMCQAQQGEQPALQVTCSQNTATVPPYEVFEISFQHDNDYANPFSDVTIEVTFRSPSGEQAQVGGFHYGSSTPPKIETRQVDSARGKRQVVDYIFDKHDLWKARFAPAELGEWRYSYVFSDAEGQKASGEGTFRCVEGRVHNRGFVRQNPSNPFRWVFDDGTSCFPIGLQDCWTDESGTGSVLDECSMEGPFRLDRERFPDPPPQRSRDDRVVIARGTVVGTVTSKGRAWVEIKSDTGKTERYIPEWIGGAPRDGGGPEQRIVDAIAQLAIGDRVSVKWYVTDHVRIEDIRVVP